MKWVYDSQNDCTMSSYSPLHPNNMSHRVFFHDNGCILVQEYSALHDKEHEAVYDSFEDMPEWLQRKVAALHMVRPPDRGSYGGEYIKGVGRRMSKATYWIERENGEGT